MNAKKIYVFENKLGDLFRVPASSLREAQFNLPQNFFWQFLYTLPIDARLAMISIAEQKFFTIDGYAK